MLLTTLGCDQTRSEAVQTDEPGGTLRFAVGEDLRELPHGEVRCRDVPGALEITIDSHEVIRGPQGVPARPRLFLARVVNEEVEEAILFVPTVVLDEVTYPMLTIFGAMREEQLATESECRFERDEDAARIVCNEGRVFPWRGGGPAPSGSFDVTYHCVDGS